MKDITVLKRFSQSTYFHSPCLCHHPTSTTTASTTPITTTTSTSVPIPYSGWNDLCHCSSCHSELFLLQKLVYSYPEDTIWDSNNVTYTFVANNILWMGHIIFIKTEGQHWGKASSLWWWRPNCGYYWLWSHQEIIKFLSSVWDGWDLTSHCWRESNTLSPLGWWNG